MISLGNHRPDSSRAGFTVFEVLVSSGLLATLGVMMATMYQLSGRGLNDTRERQERLHSARVAMTWMTRDISMAYLSKHIPTNEDLNSDQRKTFFDGQNQQINFTSLSHRRLIPNAAQSDQVELGYRVGRHESYPGEHVLLRRMKTQLDGSPGSGGVEMVVCRGVQELEFAYWDEHQERWSDDWEVDFEDLEDPTTELARDEGEQMRMDWLPYRVKIRLTLETDDEDFILETQTPIFMRRSFNFQKMSGKGRGGARAPGSPIKAPVPLSSSSTGLTK
jgi:general secretion pathway protein J